jgi:hypothetical protein
MLFFKQADCKKESKNGMIFFWYASALQGSTRWRSDQQGFFQRAGLLQLLLTQISLTGIVGTLEGCDSVRHIVFSIVLSRPIQKGVQTIVRLYWVWYFFFFSFLLLLRHKMGEGCTARSLLHTNFCTREALDMVILTHSLFYLLGSKVMMDGIACVCLL